jgi:hypothetical protein
MIGIITTVNPHKAAANPLTAHTYSLLGAFAEFLEMNFYAP